MKNKGRFKKGHIPYNKGIKRGSVSPDTEFKKGKHSPNFKGYGTPRISKRKEIYTTLKTKIKRINPRNGKEYITRKRTTYARYLWTKCYGKIHKNMVIYNTNNKDPKNIKIENLRMITRAELIKINKCEIKE